MANLKEKSARVHGRQTEEVESWRAPQGTRLGRRPCLRGQPRGIHAFRGLQKLWPYIIYLSE